MAIKSFSTNQIDRVILSQPGASVTYMVLAAGGGAGGAYSAGGGAGGLAYGTTLVKLNLPYITTIGAGGGQGLRGGNSESVGIIGYGGGGSTGGVTQGSNAEGNGGSGGGGAGFAATTNLGGNGILGQGNPGGMGLTVFNDNASGGGGGGYSSIGYSARAHNGSGGNGGNGGDPMGLGSTYARGGGGAYHGSSTPSGANTGNGGNSFAFSGGQNGSSGLVVLRYNSIYNITLSAGLTGSTSTSSGLKTTTITAGTGTVTFS